MKKLGLLLLIALAITSCGRTISPTTKELSEKEKEQAKKESYFVLNKIGNPQSHQFLTSSPDSDEHPIWSPDGKYIAFQRGNPDLGKPYNIWVMKADGSEPTKITNCEYDCQQPTWSPDGRFIAYRKSIKELDEDGNRQFDIFQMDMTNKKEMPFIKIKGAIEKHPYYSFDNQYVVFSSTLEGSAANLYTLRMDSLQEAPRCMTNNTATQDAHPSFSKDGQMILFHSYMVNEGYQLNDTSEMLYPTKLGLVSSAGDKEQEWLSLPDTLVFAKHPFYTKDPQIITFHASHKETDWRNIFAMDFEFLKPIQITNVKNAKHPNLSPNAQYLAFAQSRRLKEGLDKQYDIVVVKVNFNLLKKLLREKD